MKSVTVLGSTGVIGTQTLDVLAHLSEHYVVKVLAAGRNAERLAEQIRVWRPECVSVADEETLECVRQRLSGFRPLPEFLSAMLG
ncbi:hypothetical protein GCM10025857_03620 [Alicyclobacillus contaminans]|nr:hypothetical protein GCM10025857_03620 [Alicyclobacillus contaminans]